MNNMNATTQPIFGDFSIVPIVAIFSLGIIIMVVFGLIQIFGENNPYRRSRRHSSFPTTPLIVAIVGMSIIFVVGYLVFSQLSTISPIPTAGNDYVSLTDEEINALYNKGDGVTLNSSMLDANPDLINKTTEKVNDKNMLSDDLLLDDFNLNDI